MEAKSEETTKRSILKAVTWRILASFITASIAYVLVRDVTIATAVGFADAAIKMFVYYFHERLWNRMSYGRKKHVIPGTKRADLVGVGEEFETYEFHVSPEFNQQYIEALDDHHPRYSRIVHPGLLIYYSNAARSPSFYLPPGMAALQAKDEVQFLNPGRVGKTFKVYWKVVDMYEKRGRPYQIKEALVTDEDGILIMQRRITDTYVSGNK